MFVAWSSEVLELCREFKDRGVVGMDLAGSENFTEKNPTQEEHIQAFKVQSTDAAVRGQKAVSTYFASKQIMSFGSALFTRPDNR